eukprot:5705948-Amphidinium_carterae.2
MRKTSSPLDVVEACATFAEAHSTQLLIQEQLPGETKMKNASRSAVGVSTPLSGDTWWGACSG